MTYSEAGGWFASVNSHAVTHHALPDKIVAQATTWADVGPHSVVFHYQAGCNGDLWQVEVDRGFPIITFNVDLQGVIRQYLDARAAPWHAFDVSRYALGIEHAALPGTCELNDAQLTASAALAAALVEWTHEEYGLDIPVRRIGPITPANYRTAAGFFGHVDIEPGSALNPNQHTDTLYHWTWDRYLAEVARNLEVDDVTPEQAKTIADAQAFLTALQTTLGKVGDPTVPATPRGAGNRVARSTAAHEAGKP